MGYYYYFASAAVAVDSSHMTASPSASWSRLTRVDNVVHGLLLATITGRWLGETPFVQVSTTWALTCPATVHQRPCLTREIETWLSDIVKSTTVWLTTLSDDQPSLHCVTVLTDVMSDHKLGVEMQAMEVDARHQHTQYIGQFGRASMIWSILSVAALWHREGGATLLSTGSHESCVGCRQPEIRRIPLWSWVSMKLHLAHTGSSPHWTAVDTVTMEDY